MYLQWYVIVTLFLHHSPNYQAYMKPPWTSTIGDAGISTLHFGNHHMMQNAVDNLLIVHGVKGYLEVSNMLYDINSHLVTYVPVPVNHKHSSTNYVAHHQQDASSQLHDAADRP